MRLDWVTCSYLRKVNIQANNEFLDKAVNL